MSSRTRDLVQSGSGEPVTLGMRAHRMFLPDQQIARVDEHIVFRMPAHAFDVVDLDDAEVTNQRLGMKFWSRSLEPVQPDIGADLAACAPRDDRCRVFGPPDSRVAARRAAGEYIMRVEVTGVLRTAEDRQRVLWGRSGMTSSTTRYHGPCTFRHDPVLDMLATEEPADAGAASACNLRSFVGAYLPDGRRFRPANFLKLEPDGTPRFVVRCGAYIANAPDVRPLFCELQGYLGQWPLFLWVLSDRATEWDETFLRVRDHLAHSVITRSD